MSPVPRLAGVVSLVVGALLCLPGAGVALAMALHHEHDLGGISLSIPGGGSLSFTGNQAWIFLGGLALFGMAFVLLGCSLPNPTANHPVAGKAGIGRMLTIEHCCPSLPEPGRSADSL